jgi:hypothetical protein
MNGVWAVPELGRVCASVTGEHKVAALDVRAEICFDLTVDVRNPTPQELSQLVFQALKQEADDDGGAFATFPQKIWR